ncbi:MAG: ABC transporter substrate-binding protein [Nitrososphaerales archaeon]
MKRNSRRVSITTAVAVVIVVIVVVIAGVGGYYLYTTSNSSTTSSSHVLNVGLFTSISGTYATDGAQAKAAMQIGVKQINSGGGVNIAGTNYTLNLITVDIGSDASAAPGLADAALSTDNFVGAIGSDISGMSLAVEGNFETHQVPWIEGGISNLLSAVNSTGNGPQYKYFFSTSYNVTVAGNVATTFVQKLNAISPVKSFAIFYENSEYGVGTANATYTSLKAAGFNASVYQSYPTPLTAADAASIATAAKQANVQLVIPISNSQADGELLAQALHTQGVNAAVFGQGPAFGPTYAQAIGSSANYVFDNDGWFPDLAPAFASQFYAATGTNATVTAGTTYIQLWVLVAAMQKASAPTAQAIQQSLASIDLKSGPAFQMYGEIKFSTTTHRDINAPIFIAQDLNGTFHTVYPQSLATGTLVWPIPSS